jgi:hypothetical protein
MKDLELYKQDWDAMRLSVLMGVKPTFVGQITTSLTLSHWFMLDKLPQEDSELDLRSFT